MNHRIALLAALGILALPSSGIAQVANGTFESGTASWSFKDATFLNAAGRDCGNASYAATTKNTSKKGTAPAAGRIAQATPFIHFSPGSWALCRDVEQTVYIPMGTQLKFAMRVGEGIYGSQYQIESANLSVLIVDGAHSTTLFSQTGRNVVCGYGEAPCPVFRNQVVDVSPYWGKTVRLVFRGATAVRNGQLGGISEPSYAYVDNVRLE